MKKKIKKRFLKSLPIITFLGGVFLTSFFWITYFSLNKTNIPETQRKINFCDKKTQTIANKKQTDNLKNKKEREIDGIFVSKEKNTFPLAIMIENHKQARPQAGLSEAGLVFEIPVEGGITRFLAIFTNDKKIEKLGPVRSARPYFITLANAFSPIYAHVGGSPQALRILKRKQNLFDLNQFFQSKYFWRSSKRKRPHNVYTSTELLNQAIKEYYLKKKKIEKWLFKYDIEMEKREDKKQKIKIDFSTFNNNVQWVYDKKTNFYYRYQSEEKHIDANNKKQISAKNLIIQKTNISSIDKEDRKKIKIIGKGEAIIFLDGKTIKATWKKNNKENRTRYFDKNNKEIKFNRGATWVEIIDQKTPINF